MHRGFPIVDDPSENRQFSQVFHKPPQHFPLSNSIPTATPPNSSPRRPGLLHSLNNATVWLPLRGASRLGKRRKGTAELSRQRFRICGNADFAIGHGASNRLPTVARMPPRQLLSATPLGNRVAAEETEGEPGTSLRARTKVRGVLLQRPRSERHSRVPDCEVLASVAAKLQAQLRLPGFRKGGGSESPTQHGTPLKARRGGWPLRASFSSGFLRPLAGSAYADINRAFHSRAIATSSPRTLPSGKPAAPSIPDVARCVQK